MSIVSGVLAFLFRPETFFAEYRPHESIDVPIAAISLAVVVQIVAVAAFVAAVLLITGVETVTAATGAVAAAAVRVTIETFAYWVLLAGIVHLVLRIVRAVDEPVSFETTFGVVAVTALLEIPLVLFRAFAVAFTSWFTDLEGAASALATEPGSYGTLVAIGIALWQAYIWHGGLVATTDVDRARLWWPVGVGVTVVVLTV